MIDCTWWWWDSRCLHREHPLLLFERGAACVGLDFLAHPFWDKYIEFEERQDAQDKIYAILSRVIHIPMHQYARYYERLRTMAATRPLQEMATADRLASLRTEVEMEAASRGEEKSESELEVLVRGKIEQAYYEIFSKNQTETTKRWTYEAEIKRPYFHVTELDNPQLVNWRKYLDFEEQEGSYARICFLYERCLVTCAFYEEFWFRYARWMSAQPGKTEDVRNIYLRAATLYVPISRPGIRLQYAYLEESLGRIDVARDIHNAILAKLPGCIEVIISLAHLERRQSNVEAAITVYKQQIDSPEVDIWTKAVLVTEWAYLMWRAKGSVDEARAVFQKNVQWYSGSREFWQKWIQLELEQPTNDQLEAQHSERLKDIFTKLRESSMSTASKKELCATYLAYLQQRGGKGAMEQFLLIDREMFGPASVSLSSTGKSGAKENGVAVSEVDEATRQKAEARYYSFYQLHTDPSPAAQGLASFH